jgi:sec-independent protein translocase protein TatB
MFDIGFSELVVIGVVALIVIGPERLPKVARTVGLLVGRLQRYVNDVKADINREMELDELRKIQTQFQDAAREVESSVNSELSSAEQSINQTIAPLQGAVTDAASAIGDPGYADPHATASLDAALQAAAADLPPPVTQIPVPPAENFNTTLPLFESAPEQPPVPAPVAPAADAAPSGAPATPAGKSGSA